MHRHRSRSREVGMARQTAASCRHWQNGKGCDITRCQFFHDPNIKYLNFCHAYQRNMNGIGGPCLRQGCTRLHELPEEQTSISDMFNIILDYTAHASGQDSREILKQARSLYSRFHPDSMPEPAMKAHFAKAMNNLNNFISRLEAQAAM